MYLEHPKPWMYSDSLQALISEQKYHNEYL